MTKAEEIAGDYLRRTRGLEPLYEPARFLLRGKTTYTPDWGIYWPCRCRDFFEVKNLWRNAGGDKVIAEGYRWRETLTKMRWLKANCEPWNWRVFLLSVDRGSVKEKEIL